MSASKRRPVRGAEGRMRARVRALLLEGRSVREVAEDLGTTTQNVYRHKANLIKSGEFTP